LAAFYPFNGNADDASGRGNNGAVNGPILTTDRFGIADSAYSFDGINDFIKIQDAAANDLSPRSTISFWIKPKVGYGSPAEDNIQIISKWGRGGPGLASYNFGVTSSGLPYVAGSDGIKGQRAIDTLSIPTDDWHQLTVVIDLLNFKLFRDGILRFSTNLVQPQQNSSLNLNFGREETGNYAFYGGKLDDVRIYSRALSEQEVLDLYNYESRKEPWLSISVENVRVTMHVRPSRKYQLEASLGLNNWTKVGGVFTATSSEITQLVSAVEVGRYFRLVEVP